MSKKLEGRFYSLDLTRGFIVILSVYLSNIPFGGYEYLRHGEWYGITILDFILPAFVTIFGTGMSFAYQKGVHWGKLSKRTIRLILYGLIFNMIVMWDFNFDLLRYTGVLQLYAFLGIATVIITKLVKKPIYMLLTALIVLLIHGLIFAVSTIGCGQSLPQPGCNPSGIIDKIVFGMNHMYRQGASGYDPEGLLTMFAALSNVLIGYWAGCLLLKKRLENKMAWKELFITGAILVLLSYVFFHLLPYNKKIWTPSFAMLTAGSTLGLLGLLHLIFDRNKQLTGPIRLIEAYGRNSFFVYFGKFIVASLLTHLTININDETLSYMQVLYGWIDRITDYPQLTYAFIILFGWTLIVWILYKNKIYIKV